MFIVFCIWVFAHVSVLLWRTEEDAESPGTRVTGDCESPYVMEARNQTWISRKAVSAPNA